MTIKAIRYHDFSCGHRVVGHEGKCAHLHGHNYRVHFHVESAAVHFDKPRRQFQGDQRLDEVGRVVDFSVIKALLCDWLENHWDHKMLLWTQDPVYKVLYDIDDFSPLLDREADDVIDSLVAVPFNPTAENMAEYLLTVVGPAQLPPNIILTKVVVEETRKCSAEASL